MLALFLSSHNDRTEVIFADYGHEALISFSLQKDSSSFYFK